MAGGISVHAVDVARGRVADGMLVQIERLRSDGSRARIAEGRIGANGTLDHPVVGGEGVDEGTYEVLFHVGAFYGETAPFLDIVPFRFTVGDAAPHYHLPIKFTPFGFSLYRGA
jgi:5-hydroxyisourate hydrolase